ncbi:PLC-like phosphodiesterase, partial [Pseudovirgaria hyperparasitica]
CNNYPEFCSRKYSNITEVAAHNSPYSVKNNAASNQALDVTQQLDDGIRMLQGSIHYENETLYFCHTSCDLLNAGTVEQYLTKVVTWLRSNPYEVVTILLGNSDQVSVTKYVDPIQNSGLGTYVYEPPKIPMAASDWPTLEEMILSQKRVVIFMDYSANQQEVPYVLDQFSQLWETPFSPTDVNFPCYVNRPPGISDEQARDRMYLANHNLNTEVKFAGETFLIPNTAVLDVANGVDGMGSLGNMTGKCTQDWGKPPNFLIVDYYNRGSFNGSVFEVAAQANNVTYN